MRDSYLDECAIIAQNCTYTAEAHYYLAIAAKRRAVWLETVPAICAAVSSSLVAAGLVSTKLLPLTILSATVSAVSATLNPNKTNQDHLAAAKSFTALKHDARYLRQAEAAGLSDDALCLAVRHLHDRYNDLSKSTPPTDPASMAAAQRTVQSGVHEPDREKSGKLK